MHQCRVEDPSRWELVYPKTDWCGRFEAREQDAWAEQSGAVARVKTLWGVLNERLERSGY